MMFDFKKHGNYWLDLIDLENSIKKTIKEMLDKFVGKICSDKLRLRLEITNVIINKLNEISLSTGSLILNPYYELELEFDQQILTSYNLKYFYLQDK